VDFSLLQTADQQSLLVHVLIQHKQIVVRKAKRNWLPAYGQDPVRIVEDIKGNDCAA
jgi:hypothetical protein